MRIFLCQGADSQFKQPEAAEEEIVTYCAPPADRPYPVIVRCTATAPPMTRHEPLPRHTMGKADNNKKGASSIGSFFGANKEAPHRASLSRSKVQVDYVPSFSLHPPIRMT